MSEPKHALFCSFGLTKRLSLFYLCFSPIFMLVQCRFFMRNDAVDASASCRIYNNVGCRKVMVDCLFVY